MKKPFTLLLLSLISISSLYSQGVHKMDMPHIKGYKTLICDFHSHTIYSDGSVMPKVRVEEALREGVDVIAVTEHIEEYCRKIPETRHVDLNTSYNLHLESAKDSELIVIRGGEISRGMPPGHLNALFLKDVNPLDTEHSEAGVWQAIDEASSQGAFIIWNHPGWKYHQPDTTLWFDFHSKMVERGLLHGIEIVNWTTGPCLEALGWYGDHNLAPIAGPDTHGPTGYEFDLINSHRPVTLVFVEDADVNGVKEALFDKRSLAYDGNFIYGSKIWLNEIFVASVKQVSATKNGDSYIVTYQNSSDVNYEMSLDSKLINGNVPQKFTIKAQGETQITVDFPVNTDFLNAEYKCMNLLYDRDQYLVTNIKIQK